MGTTSPPPETAEIWRWLAEIPDPEIPVISVVDLGIVREVRWQHGAGFRELIVSVTPTYTGCPAASAILSAIESALRARGVKNVRLETRLFPPWTTDWISPAGRRNLEQYGIAPPAERANPFSPLARSERRAAPLACPRCGSANTARVSEFGSTPCKAQYRCRDCLEPFDYFKCI